MSKQLILQILAVFILLAAHASAMPDDKGNSAEEFYPGVWQDAQLDRAEELVARGEQLQAIIVFEDYLQKKPNSPRVLYRLAQLYSWNEMPEKAVRCYEKIVALQPDNRAILQKLAQFYIWTDRQKDAIRIYEKLSAMQPANITYHKKLAQLYSWNDMPEKAIREYETIVQMDSTDVATMRMLAQHYFWSDRGKEGIKLLEKVVALIPDSLSVRRQLAQQYEWHNMPQKAIEQYEIILQRDAGDEKIAKKLAALYTATNHFEKAAEIYRTLLRKNPDDVKTRLALARVYLWSDKSALAAREFEKYLQLEPNDIEARLLLAEIQRWSGQWDKAKQHLQKVLAMDAGNEKALKLLRSIRKDYGPMFKGQYSYIRDSNQITRQEIPLGYYYYFNRHWQVQVGLQRINVSDGRVDSTLSGYGATIAAQYTTSPQQSFRLQVSPLTYQSSWNPLIVHLDYTRNVADRVYINFGLYRSETREGVQALLQRIVTHGIKGSLYWQITSRWSAFALYNRGLYSDDNGKVTASFQSEYAVFAEPRIALYYFHSYEDFERIYPTSLPYWTPDRLQTASIGISAEKTFLRRLSAKLGFALTRQQKVLAKNVHFQFGLQMTEFDRLFLQYDETGSTVYNARSIQLSYHHRL